MIAKRIFDLIVASAGLVVLAPLFFVIAAWIKLDSSGPVFFRQERVGRHGRIFRIHKFRTMRTDADRAGLQLTAANDRRITRTGTLLRKHKLDEWPQLIDVVQGTMSLVGPHPEVPAYVARYPDDLRRIVLSGPPGITDNASIEFHDESRLLGLARDPEGEYLEVILPKKLSLYVKYVRERSLWFDIVLITRTLRTVICKRTAHS